MCTIGAVIQNGRTYLLKNFDYAPTPTGWAFFEGPGIPHFALVDHDQQGVNSGFNASGLALQISRSKCLADVTPEREESRTVLNGAVLADCAAVAEAVAKIEAYARQHPQMFGGNVMLGDCEQIAVTEYFGGDVRTEFATDGFLARANHSVLGVVDNETEGSVRRYERRVGFLQELYAWLPTLDSEDVVARCRAVLRQEPILNENTRSSFVVNVAEGRVDYLVGAMGGSGKWRTFWMEDRQVVKP